MLNSPTQDAKIIIALDDDIQRIDALLEKLNPSDVKLKVGKEMFVRYGPAFVKNLVKRNFDVFLDLKFHDIPNTVARACQAAADLEVWMLNVHASGGSKMLEAARSALEQFGNARPKLIAVTLLTSFAKEDLQQIGCETSISDQVLHLAQLTRTAELDGIVCAAPDLANLTKQLPPNFLYVTPGIRPQNSQSDDQKRTMTPSQALNSGASYLVIGRPITQASDPQAALKQIQLDITENFR